MKKRIKKRIKEIVTWLDEVDYMLANDDRLTPNERDYYREEYLRQYEVVRVLKELIYG